MIYLNNAATSWPKPKEVVEAVNNCLNSPPYHASRTGMERDCEDIFYSCRNNLAKLFNISDPNQIVFTSGSTEALNLAIRGLNLKGAHVVTTKIEHNSVIRPLKTLEQKGEIEVTFVDCDSQAYVTPEAIEAAIRPNTKLIVINLCSNVTGTVLDAEAIAKVAHRHGCLILVDGSQASGNVPVDVDKWDIDFYAFTGHKSLFGMPGTGGLYIKPGTDLEPLKVGGTGILSEVLLQPPGMPIYYEAGTPNTPGVVSLNAGVEFVLRTGLDNIIAHKKHLLNKMVTALREFPEVSIYNTGEHNSGSVLCFNIAGMVPEEVGYWLESSYDIEVRTGLHCAPLLRECLGVYPWGTVRASPSYFTTDEEIDVFIEAVTDVVTFMRKNASRKG